MEYSPTTHNASVQFTTGQTTSTFDHLKEEVVVECSIQSHHKARPDMEGDGDDIVTIAEARQRLEKNAPTRDAFHKAVKRGKLAKHPAPSDDRDFRFRWADILDYIAKGGFKNCGFLVTPSNLDAAIVGEIDPSDLSLLDDEGQPAPPPTPLERCSFIIPVIEDLTADSKQDETHNGVVLLGEEESKRQITPDGESALSQSHDTLNVEDISYLTEREAIVSVAVKSSIAGSKALHEIRTYRNGILWKKDFPNFEHYLLAKWGYQKSYGYKLAEIGGFVAELVCCDSANAEKLPRNEGQLRPLFAAVPKEHRVECWNEITATKNPSELTGSIVAEAAKKFAKAKGLAVKQPKAAKTSDRTRAMNEIAKLRCILAKLPDPGRFNEHLLSITTLIEQESGDGVIEVSATEVVPTTGSELLAESTQSA